jgi:hypothetical protein
VYHHHFEWTEGNGHEITLDGHARAYLTPIHIQEHFYVPQNLMEE